MIDSRILGVDSIVFLVPSVSLCCWKFLNLSYIMIRPKHHELKICGLDPFIKSRIFDSSLVNPETHKKSGFWPVNHKTRKETKTMKHFEQIMCEVGKVLNELESLNQTIVKWEQALMTRNGHIKST